MAAFAHPRLPIRLPNHARIRFQRLTQSRSSQAQESAVNKNASHLLGEGGAVVAEDTAARPAVVPPQHDPKVLRAKRAKRHRIVQLPPAQKALRVGLQVASHRGPYRDRLLPNTLCVRLDGPRTRELPQR